MEKKKLIYGSTALTLVVIGIVVGMMVSQSLLAPIMPDRFWRSVSATGDPGVGESGLLNITIVAHDAGRDWTTNLTTHYAYGTTWNGSLKGDVPYDTEFNIAIKARYNVTHAYNGTSSAWEIALVRANITCADLSIGALTAMDKAQITTTDTYMYVYFYLNNSGSGYTRTHGVTTNSSVVLQANY